MARALPDDYMPYAPATPFLDVLRRIREGKLAEPVTLDGLSQVGIAEGNAPRVLNGLRFMGLVDDDGRRTQQAERLRRASTDEDPGILAETVLGVYARVIQVVDLSNATDIQLNDAFRPFEPSAQRPKMVALFQALAREANLLPGGPVHRRPRTRATQDSNARGSIGRAAPQRRRTAPPAVQSTTSDGRFFGLSEADLQHLDDNDFAAVWDALGKVTRAKLRAAATPRQTDDGNEDSEE